MTDLALTLRSYAVEAKTHSHDHHQLVLPVAGTLALSIDGRGGAVSDALAAVIPAGTDHNFSASGPNQFLVADIPEALAPTLDRLPAFFDLDAGLTHYVRFLQHQASSAEGGTNTHRQMMMLLLQLMEERHRETIRTDRRVAVARAYLDEHYQQQVSLARLAQLSHLSPRQLTELFKRQLGMTPQHYLIECRMQQARHLLVSTSLSVQAVAENVGYTSVAAFSDRFRKHVGHAPAHFRQLSKRH
ncbi:AraC family transcriptional regulator [Marinobacter zhejiangensis]|uniref:AraC-type DNA-binding protein n=1 Tax=Marinobacter zhejiangensis TaxID=488535 RepID=A0A1I4TL98_9GAMM|nr:AraC family transcriptional regulator [Marinobacter zhejiangensis]SFM77425.1 AraC-type DNA-binding protein [Marinobacter zhejiangensis]